MSTKAHSQLLHPSSPPSSSSSPSPLAPRQTAAAKPEPTCQFFFQTIVWNYHKWKNKKKEAIKRCKRGGLPAETSDGPFLTSLCLFPWPLPCPCINKVRHQALISQGESITETGPAVGYRRGSSGHGAEYVFHSWQQLPLQKGESHCFKLDLHWTIKSCCEEEPRHILGFREKQRKH